VSTSWLKPPCPSPRRIDTEPSPWLATAKSSLPSALKSAVSNPCGIVPTLTEDEGVAGNEVVNSRAATGTYVTLDLPPPGRGTEDQHGTETHGGHESVRHCRSQMLRT